MKKIIVILVIVALLTIVDIPTIKTDSVYQAPETDFDWSAFWVKFKQHSQWDLEANQGAEWISCKSALVVDISTIADNEKKVTLNFTAPVTGDYRLTFAIDHRVRDYVDRTDQYVWELTYQNFTLEFDFSDIANIPGIILSHGIHQDMFWFRARKNGVSEGTFVSLDPRYVIYSVSSCTTSYNSQRKLARQSNGTLYAVWSTTWPGNDIYRSRSFDDGVTWTSIVQVGTDNLISYFPSIAIDSDDVIHICWQGHYTGVNIHNIRYTNSTDWNNIVNVTVTTTYNQQYPSIAINSTDIPHIVWCGGYTGAPGNNQQIRTAHAPDWVKYNISDEATVGDHQYYPSLAINLSDSLCVAWKGQDYANNMNQILYSCSRDGISWTNESQITNDTKGDQENPNIMVDDRDYIHCAWWAYNNKTIGYAINRTTGWETPQVITDTGWETDSPTLSCDADNIIYLLYQIKRSGGNNVIQYTYNNSVSWSTLTNITDNLSSNLCVPNTISAQYPLSYPNRPLTDFALVFTNTTGQRIMYYDNGSLTWNTPLNVSNPNPANGSTGIDPNPTLNVTVNGNDVNVTWWSNSSGTWQQFGSNTSVPDGSVISWVPVNFTDCDTTYYWSVNITNGTAWINRTYHFTTRTNTCPVISNPSPANKSVNVSITPTLCINITDANGDSMIINITTSFGQTQEWVGVGNGTYCLPQSSLASNTNYSWRVNVTDSPCNCSVTSWYWFITRKVPPANINDVLPEDQGYDLCPCCLVFCVNFSSNMSVNISFYLRTYWEPTYDLVYTIVNVTNGTRCFTGTEVEYDRAYYWYVRINEYRNISNYITSPTYYFSTTDDIYCCCNGNGTGTTIWLASSVGVVGLFGLLSWIMADRRKRRKKRRRF